MGGSVIQSDKKPKYTHYGWFGFCPVKLGNLEQECVSVHPRWDILQPLLWLAIKVQQARITACVAMFPEWEPAWKIYVGEPIQ